MKVTAFIFFAFCLQVSAATLAQTVTLSERKAPLYKIINKIKQQTGYSFFYNQEWMEKANLVDIQVSDVSLETALKLCFLNQPFSYAIVNKTIVLKLIEEREQESIILKEVIVSGRVTDSVGTPLQGATLISKGHTFYITNSNGDFSLTSNVGDIIVVSFVGYKSFRFKVTEDLPFQKIVLNAVSSALKEVSVIVSTGYQSANRERVTGSFDQIGQKLVNRSTGTNILDRLNGIASGVRFNGTALNNVSTNPGNRILGINIRGESTLSNSVGRDPLIVLDNFPYEGNISNINPNDIESISVLKVYISEKLTTGFRGKLTTRWAGGRA